jgi:hypothetical protein
MIHAPDCRVDAGQANDGLDRRPRSRMLNVTLDVLSRPGVQLTGASVTCPCVWKAEGTDARPVRIPRYNNENRWYIEKYQHREPV